MQKHSLKQLRSAPTNNQTIVNTKKIVRELNNHEYSKY